MSSLYDGLPPSIRIGPFDITVTIKEKVNKADSWGEYDHGVSIELCQKQPNPSLAIDTLLHEILHSIYKCAGLGTKSPEESVVSAFATGLTQVLRDNPKVLEWLDNLGRSKRQDTQKIYAIGPITQEI